MYNIYLYGAPARSRIVKFLIIMKLIFLFLIMALMQTTASTKAQTITLNRQNISITAVFEEIMMQSDFDFSYSEQQISKVGRINISVTNASITEVLDKCFQGQPLTYSIKGKNIIIVAKKSSLLQRPVDKLNNIDVQGTVVDETGSPLVDATVKIKGSKTSVSTDSQGRFSIQDIAENAILVISYIGYQTKEIPATINIATIKLEPSSSDLQEIEINAGYYTVKERERTGNIVKISSNTIEKQPVSNPLQALQNRVPGMQITQSTGISGGSFNVQIRGRSSINTQVGNDPLYIIDGVTYPSTNVSLSYIGNILGTNGTNPLSLINPSDIENIEVLKDADATAIYGSRGANGVILIKTKRGVSGKTKINASFTQSFSKVASYIDLLNTSQYIEMRKEALKNDRKTVSATDYDINGTWDQGKYTDWQEMLIGGIALSSKAALTFRGGTEKVNYLLGGTYYREETVYPGESNYNRAGIQSNLNFGTEKDRLRVNFSLNYNNVGNYLIRTDLTSLITLAPNAPDPYDQFGQLNWQNNTVYQNPMAYLLVNNNIKTDNLIGNININYNITRHLAFKTSAGYNFIKTDEFNKIPMAYTSPANSPTSANRISYFSNISNRTWLAEPQFNYCNKLLNGRLEALIGMSLQENISDIRSVRATNFSNDQLMENQGAAAQLVNNLSSYNQYRYIAAFTRLNYNLKDKYILNLTARRDGSSRFGSDKQFANFGALGAAWIFSEENFIKKHLPLLSFGKLRASYGLTGNDQIPNYGYLQLYNTSGTYQGFSTIMPSTSNIGNPDFAWETNRKLEFAIQLSFAKERINIEASWYQNNSSNQLIGEPLPLSTGNLTVRANRPATVENTGLELLSAFKLISSTNWKWSSSFNLTLPKNKLISYPGLEHSGDAIDFIVGKSLSIYKTYNLKGVNPQTGLYEPEDYDNNGLMDDNDRYLYKFTGQYYYGGFHNSLSYKKLSLDFLLGFTKQNGRNYISSLISPGLWSSNTYFNGNQPQYVLRRWQEVGEQTEIQRYSTNSISKSPYNLAKRDGGLSISDASYIRLKTISLTYTLPTPWANRLGINNANLSLSGQNLFTLTGYKGLDPETQSMSILPPLKTWAMGINITF